MKLSEIQRELYSCKLNKMAEQEEIADLCQIFTYIPPFSERALFSSCAPFLFPLRALEHPDLSHRDKKKEASDVAR